MSRDDWDRVTELLHPDYVEDYPQSGERIRGRKNAVAVRRDYPGGRSTERMEMVVGGEDRWALAPNFTAIRVAAAGDSVTAVVRARYPDGYWYITLIATVGAGQITRATVVFGKAFDPPAWRAGMVEAMPSQDR